MAFVATAIIASLPMVFACGAIVDTLPCGSILLKETLALMGGIEDQRELAPKGALV